MATGRLTYWKMHIEIASRGNKNMVKVFQIVAPLHVQQIWILQEPES